MGADRCGADVASANASALVRWAEGNRRATVSDYSWAVRDDIEAAGLPIVMVFVNDDGVTNFNATAAVPPSLLAAARKHAGRAVFLTFRKVGKPPPPSPMMCALTHSRARRA